MTANPFVPLAKLNSVQRAALLVVCCMPPLYFVLFRGWGLSLWDEGFLWYGAQRVMAGEVPIRDFQAYDVGRYYWSAAVMSLLRDDGIVAMRVSNMFLQIAAVGLATYAVLRATPSAGLGYGLAVGISFFLWTYPVRDRHYVAVAALLWALALFFERPTIQRAIAYGIVVGAVAILGRNHGVYGAVAGLAAVAYLAWKQNSIRFVPGLAWFSAGILLGYLPMLVTLAVVPGLPSRFSEGIRWIFEHRETNIPLLWPRPWWVRFDQLLPWEIAAGEVLVGALLPALPAFGALGIGVLCAPLFGRHATATPVFASAVFLAVPYSHYAWARAEVIHLALGIFPFLTGIWTLPWTTAAPRTRAVLAAPCVVPVCSYFCRHTRSSRRPRELLGRRLP